MIMEDVCNNDNNLDLDLNNVCTEELSQGSVDGNKFEKFVVGEDSKKNCSLQDAFLKYKRRRQKDLKNARKRKELPDEARIRSRADPQRMWQLRMMFVNQAKKYFGVPYAKKYWTAEDPQFHSPIFLDCCALVRQVMRDLRKEFGFKIGPWNQSYLCDTLPIVVEKEEDMKPGDLVFVSAIYNNPKMKKQKHNLTHVEIWLGDGPKTIGARWQKGKVQVFDSYMFNATAYHSPVYIFKSIDTWLMGICRSHCPQHIWRLRCEVFEPAKKSVFALAEFRKQESQRQSIEEEDESASDADDAESVNITKSNNEVSLPLLNIGRAQSLPCVVNHVDGKMLQRTWSDLSSASVCLKTGHALQAGVQDPKKLQANDREISNISIKFSQLTLPEIKTVFKK